MSLSSGKADLESTLAGIWSGEGTLRSVAEYAADISQAIYTFAHSGIPTTIIITLPGAVSGAMTAGNVMGTGLGGFDKPVPGLGLTAALPGLKSDLVEVWSHRNSIKTFPVVAQQTAEAIFKYYNSAIIKTKDETHGPVPAPPATGPAAGPIFGKGGTISDSFGTGFDIALPLLKNACIQIWSQIGKEISREEFANNLGDAIHAFCIQGKVTTVGAFVAPAVVSPDSLSGAYLPGIGSAVGIVF